jgi:hypothetical protein
MASLHYQKPSLLSAQLLLSSAACLRSFVSSQSQGLLASCSSGLCARKSKPDSHAFDLPTFSRYNEKAFALYSTNTLIASMDLASL